MPPFPERESSLLAKLKRKKGGSILIEKENEEEAAPNGPSDSQPASPPATTTTSPVRVSNVCRLFAEHLTSHFIFNNGVFHLSHQLHDYKLFF